MEEPLTLSLGGVIRLWNAVFAPPWGPLNSLYDHVQRTAAPLEWSTLGFRQALEYFIIPFVPIVIIAYIIVGGPNDSLARNSRELRMALGVVGWSIATNAYLSNRYHTLRWCCYNSMFGILYWQLTARYFSLALLKDPIIDPYMSLGRPRWVAALDLVMNQRHMGLGSVGLDNSSGPRNITQKPLQPGQKPKIERHYRHWRRFPRPTTRLGSTMRHLLKSLGCYVLMDTVFTLARAVGPDAIAAPAGLPLIEKYGHVMAGWLAETEGVFLPSTLKLPLPKGVMRTFMELCPPLAIWGFLTIGYHLCAAICIGSGFWEIESWDIDIFDAPLKSTSLMMLWGKRWHQTFRHTFIEASEVVLRLFHLPNNLFTFYTLIYFFSGALHSMGEITTNPVPQWTSVMRFFSLAGVGCSLEILIKRLTGIRMRGLHGWLWTWVWTSYTGLSVANAWIDAGFSTCSFFPDQGAGMLLAPWIMRHVYNIHHVPPVDIMRAAGPVVKAVAESTAQAALADRALVQSVVETVTVSARAVVETLVAVVPTATVVMAAVSAARTGGAALQSAVDTGIRTPSEALTQSVADTVTATVVESATHTHTETIPASAVETSAEFPKGEVSDRLIEVAPGCFVEKPTEPMVDEDEKTYDASIEKLHEAYARMLDETSSAPVTVAFAAETTTADRYHTPDRNVETTDAEAVPAGVIPDDAIPANASPAEPSTAEPTVRMITVDSVPSAIVAAALTEASAALKAAAAPA